MIIRLDTKAGVPQIVDKVGNYFTLISSSAGKARVKAYDEKSREVFVSVVPSGASVDFESMASKIEVETDVDAEVSIFFSKAKFPNPVVSVLGAGVARTKSLSVSGTAKLNTVTGQNKAIKIKSREGSVGITGQPKSVNGGWLLPEGESIELATGGDIYAKAEGATLDFALGAAVEIGALGSSWRQKEYDKNGDLFGLEVYSQIVGGVNFAMDASYSPAFGAVVSWRGRVFLAEYNAATLTFSEFKKRKKIHKVSVYDATNTHGGAGINKAYLSNDGTTLFGVFNNAPGGVKHVIYDLNNQKIVASWKAADSLVAAGGCIQPYADGFLGAYGSELYFISKDGIISVAGKTEENTGAFSAGLSAVMRISGGTVSVI